MSLKVEVSYLNPTDLSVEAAGFHPSLTGIAVPMNLRETRVRVAMALR